MRLRWPLLAFPAVLLLAASTLRAQTVTVYDTFSGTSLDASRWEVINEAGTDLADVAPSNGALVVRGKNYRTGVASNVRLTDHGAVEVNALGWTGTNQILQLYSGDGNFNHFIEFGEEGTAADGTPILNVWLPSAHPYNNPSPVKGLASPSNPTTLRIERNGQSYNFFANGNLVFSTTTDALDNDARVMLYGWNTSVSNWDNVKISGPDCRITAPVTSSRLTGSMDITGWTAWNTATWTLQAGTGPSPSSWTTLASGTGQANGTLAHWDTAGLAAGVYALRLLATDDAGNSRAAWSTVALSFPAFATPAENLRVGPSFAVALRDTGGYVKADYYDNGTLFATSTDAPLFRLRRVEPAGSDGAHTLTAVLTDAQGNTSTTSPAHVTVQMDLYGRNTRPADDGKAFLFPNGKTALAIGQNDGYLWPGCVDLYNGNAAATESYVADLAAHGVNVMRIMLDYGNNPPDYLEFPLGTYNQKVLDFWDKFFPICEKYNMTVLLTPWDTFWMNQPWSSCSYSTANGGPCATPHDFIVNPVARQWEKARFKLIIDRWGNSPAIFAIDLLNEFDIWWNASEQERADWINDMANYVQTYEMQKWGHRHMLTVSTAAANPTGLIGDIQYRYPLFDFANTHQYYGPVNDPQNIIDPALAVNAGTKNSIVQSIDNRPYMDSESGPISLSAPWLTNRTDFDDQYYHHMAWAHLATGGTGIGMRWPYRIPHYLDAGMHQTEKACAWVSGSLDLAHFVPVNIDGSLSLDRPNMIAMGSGDANQALVWMTEDVRTQAAQYITGMNLTVNGRQDGLYLAACWNPYIGVPLTRALIGASGGKVTVPLASFGLDLAVTLRRLPKGDLNGDFRVDMADAQLALKYASGLSVPPPDVATAADIDGSGTLDLNDAIRLTQFAEGSRPTL